MSASKPRRGRNVVTKARASTIKTLDPEARARKTPGVPYEKDEELKKIIAQTLELWSLENGALGALYRPDDASRPPARSTRASSLSRLLHQVREIAARAIVALHELELSFFALTRALIAKGVITPEELQKARGEVEDLSELYRKKPGQAPGGLGALADEHGDGARAADRRSRRSLGGRRSPPCRDGAWAAGADPARRCRCRSPRLRRRDHSSLRAPRRRRGAERPAKGLEGGDLVLQALPGCLAGHEHLHS